MKTLLKAMALMGVVAWSVAQPVLAQQTERVPALREKVYSQLARAQTAADEQGNAEGIKILKQVAERADSMNSYERAMLWNYFGFMYYDQGETGQAINYFGKVVQQEPIPESLKKSTLFSLAQLALSDGQYQQALDYVEQWQAMASDKELPKSWVLQAQALYQSEDYQQALTAIERAIEHTTDNNEVPKENWLVLARAIYYELNQTTGVAAMLEQLLINYSKPEYWIQLAGVYGQLEQTEKQLAVLEAAHQQGFIKTAEQWRNLAQVYYLNELPFKAAETIEQGLSKNILADNLSNRKFYAQSLMQAKEYQQAITAYQQAAELGDSGEMLAQAAQLAINNDKNEQALELADEALAAEDLKNPGNMYLVKGMAYVNQQQFDAALKQFKTAADYAGAKTAAQQWSRYAESQLAYKRQLAENKLN
ncbi:MAG: tetratricopeptide repeat protein [Pseudomonadota bacterium]